jgi:hypothetical protein
MRARIRRLRRGAHICLELHIAPLYHLPTIVDEHALNATIHNPHNMAFVRAWRAAGCRIFQLRIVPKRVPHHSVPPTISIAAIGRLCAFTSCIRLIVYATGAFAHALGSAAAVAAWSAVRSAVKASVPGCVMGGSLISSSNGAGARGSVPATQSRDERECHGR